MDIKHPSNGQIGPLSTLSIPIPSMISTGYPMDTLVHTASIPLLSPSLSTSLACLYPSLPTHPTSHSIPPILIRSRPSDSDPPTP